MLPVKIFPNLPNEVGILQCKKNVLERTMYYINTDSVILNVKIRITALGNCESTDFQSSAEKEEVNVWIRNVVL
jgi:hypothetical protein